MLYFFIMIQMSTNSSSTDILDFKSYYIKRISYYSYNNMYESFDTFFQIYLKSIWEVTPNKTKETKKLLDAVKISDNTYEFPSFYYVFEGKSTHIIKSKKDWQKILSVHVVGGITFRLFLYLNSLNIEELKLFYETKEQERFNKTQKELDRLLNSKLCLNIPYSLQKSLTLCDLNFTYEDVHIQITLYYAELSQISVNIFDSLYNDLPMLIDYVDRKNLHFYWKNNSRLALW